MRPSGATAGSRGRVSGQGTCHSRIWTAAPAWEEASAGAAPSNRASRANNAMREKTGRFTATPHLGEGVPSIYARPTANAGGPARPRMPPRRAGAIIAPLRFRGTDPSSRSAVPSCGASSAPPRHCFTQETPDRMNTAYRKPLPGTALDHFDTRAAVEAIKPGAYDTLPYTSRVHAENLVRRA